jgi:hypothetical protein
MLSLKLTVMLTSLATVVNMQVLDIDNERAALKTCSHFHNMQKEEQPFQHSLNFFTVNIVNK